MTKSKDAIGQLDVNPAANARVLGPIFGIDDPRTSKRINFVGGIRGTAELEKLVNAKEYACAFSMYPTSIEDLMTIADAGGIMPPKSTWFEPKLRDAMFCHMIFKNGSDGRATLRVATPNLDCGDMSRSQHSAHPHAYISVLLVI